MTSDGSHYLTEHTLDRYFTAGISTRHVLAKQPHCELVIDPASARMELLVPVDGPEPDVAVMRRVDIDSVDTDRGMCFRLTVDARDIPHEAYALVVSIVMALRGGASFAAATAAAVSNLKAVLAARTRLSAEAQIGLLGELFVVDTLLRAHPEEDVFEWWLGPAAEQHDFSLPTYDLEVKTTLGEKRDHVIHGLGQLQPNPGRPLWLLSVQVTRGSGPAARSLADLVRDVEARTVNRRRLLQVHLDSLGWRDDDADLYRTECLLRTRPAAYEVTEDFPALTAARLGAVVPHHDRVSGVTYRVDVSDRRPEDPGSPTTEVLVRKELGGE